MIFFFQAEDGIRDYKVTGVQTCALPICTVQGPVDPRRARLGLGPLTLSTREGETMERFYFWPTNPAASIFTLWILSQIFLYAARLPMHRALREVGRLLGGVFRVGARWCRGLAAVAKMPPNMDGTVKKVLEEIQKSAAAGEKKALNEFRETTAKRHKILSSMAPAWKEVQKTATDVSRAVSGALEATKRIDGYMTSYEQVRADDKNATRAIGWNATQLFVVSLLVMAVAMGGAFVNFNLIALPMSELVPSGSRIAGMPVATVAALVIVLMEIAAGVFAMEMLGIPLETMISTGGHIVLSAVTGGMHLGSMVCRLGGHGMRYLCEAARHVYDIYIVIPLQIERVVTNGSRQSPVASVGVRGQGARP